MIFPDGLYHADPHPGNFLLPDGEHMAVLDCGDVGQLTSRRRRQLEDMVIAVGTRDIDSLVDVVVAMTTPPPDVDMAELRATLELWLDRYLRPQPRPGSRAGPNHRRGPGRRLSRPGPLPSPVPTGTTPSSSASWKPVSLTTTP
jgi:ABC1 atypical kinase-like domain